MLWLILLATFLALTHGQRQANNNGIYPNEGHSSQTLHRRGAFSPTANVAVVRMPPPHGSLVLTDAIPPPPVRTSSMPPPPASRPEDEDRSSGVFGNRPPRTTSIDDDDGGGTMVPFPTDSEESSMPVRPTRTTGVSVESEPPGLESDGHSRTATWESLPMPPPPTFVTTTSAKSSASTETFTNESSSEVSSSTSSTSTLETSSSIMSTSANTDTVTPIETSSPDTSAAEHPNQQRLSNGATAGIVLASVTSVALVIFGIWFLYRKYIQRRRVQSFNNHGCGGGTLGLGSILEPYHRDDYADDELKRQATFGQQPTLPTDLETWMASTAMRDGYGEGEDTQTAASSSWYGPLSPLSPVSSSNSTSHQHLETVEMRSFTRPARAPRKFDIKHPGIPEVSGEEADTTTTTASAGGGVQEQQQGNVKSTESWKGGAAAAAAPASRIQGLPWEGGDHHDTWRAW